MKRLNFIPIFVCLIAGLTMGYLATRFLGQSLGFSPFLITIPAAFAPFFTGQMKFKKDN